MNQKNSFIAPQLNFRRACLSDSDRLLGWRNDPDARINFFNTNEVSQANHEAWFFDVLQNKNQILYIIETRGCLPIGQMRFDIDGECAEISITIGKKYRGRGYGSEAIRQGTRLFFQENIGVKSIIAQIKNINEISIRSFIRAGFMMSASMANTTKLILMK